MIIRFKSLIKLSIFIFSFIYIHVFKEQKLRVEQKCQDEQNAEQADGLADESEGVLGSSRG